MKKFTKYILIAVTVMITMAIFAVAYMMSLASASIISSKEIEQNATEWNELEFNRRDVTKSIDQLKKELESIMEKQGKLENRNRVLRKAFMEGKNL